MAAHPAQLVAISEGPNIILDKPIVLVGRHQECDIQIPSRKISRRHCCIAQVNDHLMVRDLCSTNGIRINGIRVNEGELKEGDELTIGSFRYQINWSALPENEPAPAKEGPKPAVLGKDQLDSCEEPVPMDEADVPPVRPASMMFPENIHLAPLSDSQVNASK